MATWFFLPFPPFLFRGGEHLAFPLHVPQASLQLNMLSAAPHGPCYKEDGDALCRSGHCTVKPERGLSFGSDTLGAESSPGTRGKFGIPPAWPVCICK